ncbi:MAG TPA: hypothetical protein VGR27_00215 [Longimicrobiaceae bacterium]|nr:hypothetical protein [Longimicrobiaceae bacterium]
MSIRLSGTLLIVLLLLPLSLRAQEARLDARLPPEARAEVQAIVEGARVEGLPTEPLVQRALEGASRGAEPARISGAVRDLAERLRVTRAALGGASTEAELVAGAGALYVGLSAADLRRLRETRGGVSVALPLVTLADLVERGVPPETATSVILSLLQARVPNESYSRLRQSVAQDIRQGAPPAAAAHTRAQGVLIQNRPTPPQRRSPPPRLPGRRPGGRPIR